MGFLSPDEKIFSIRFFPLNLLFFSFFLFFGDSVIRLALRPNDLAPSDFPFCSFFELFLLRADPQRSSLSFKASSCGRLSREIVIISTGLPLD